MIDLSTSSPADSWAEDAAALIRVLFDLFSDEPGGALLGRGGPDILDGTNGADLVWGARGDDVLSGGAGDDLVRGGQGADVLAGGMGADWVQGGAGPDFLSGADLTDPFGELDAAADTLEGGAGDDRLTGGGGDDTLIGGSDDDLLAGNEGADLFVFDRHGFGQDRIVDFTPGEDRVDLRGLSLAFEHVDSNGDGVIGEADQDVSQDGPDLVLALGGGSLGLSGVTGLTADDVLI